MSLIIPTLNEAECLGETLAFVSEIPGICEVIVVDGQSDDATVEIALAAGARLITAPRGRGTQLHAGACAAMGDVFWFLHADTLPPRTAAQRILSVLEDSEVIGGSFTPVFSGESKGARLFSALYPLIRGLGLIYGDASLFVRRDVYHRLGGFPPLPLFEDLEFGRAIRRAGRIRVLPEIVTTSSRRFENCASIVVLQWVLLHALYWARVPPTLLARAYHRRPKRPAVSNR